MSYVPFLSKSFSELCLLSLHTFQISQFQHLHDLHVVAIRSTKILSSFSVYCRCSTDHFFHAANHACSKVCCEPCCTVYGLASLRASCSTLTTAGSTKTSHQFIVQMISHDARWFGCLTGGSGIRTAVLLDSLKLFSVIMAVMIMLSYLQVALAARYTLNLFCSAFDNVSPAAQQAVAVEH